MNTEREKEVPEEVRKDLAETLEAETEATEPVDESVSYTHLDKPALVALAENLLKETDLRKADQTMRQLRPVFNDIRNRERNEALEKFTAEGGEPDGFEYKADELTSRFDQVSRQLKEKKVKVAQDSEKEKEKNLQTKLSLLEQLRQLTDAEETTASLDALKKIQQEWKSVGAVPAAQVKSLWANYSALIELFYSNRSIYFELKELDRKKNLATKQEICEKAEKLAAQEPSSAVIKELNDLHEEYKHVGPVPKDDQEALWQRFKAASDVIYARRREQLEGVRQDMERNLQAKLALNEAAEAYTQFESSKISDWNDKTKEILELQKQWETVGLVPRERAREINKRFWAAFKTFFHKKNEFFRQLEAFRNENLQKKIALCEQVEALLEQENTEQTAEQVKSFQQEWKQIGPVPERQRNQVFDRFKAACDAFFNRRRGERNQTEKEFEANYEKKQEICTRIEQLAASQSTDMAAFEQLRNQYQQTGFVPRKHMHTIQKRYADSVHQFLSQNKQLSDRDKDKIELSVELGVAKTNPQVHKFVQKKESTLRKRMQQLESDVALWKNNLEFFASSKTADKLKQEFSAKIQAAEDERASLKRQLQLIYENQ